MALEDPEMDFYEEDDGSFVLDSPLDDAVLPYQEEDWEFGAEPQNPMPYLDSDANGQWEDLVPYTHQQLASFYHNPLLERSDIYTNQFLESSKDFNQEFKQLLITLKKATEVVTQLKKDCEEKNILIQSLCQKVFDLEIGQIKAEGYCQDNRKVHTFHKYNICKYSDSVASKLGIAILDGQHLAVEDTMLAMYTRTLTQLQCEQFLYNAATNVRHHTKNFSENTDSMKSSILVKLADESLDIVRQCINTMFYFIRKEDRPVDNTFATSLQNWICQYVCLLFELTRDGGYQNLVNEELFVVNHIIRSPPNTQTWAERIVQISGPHTDADFWNHKLFVDHVIHLLFLILRAPKGRGEFLSTSKSIMSLKNSVEDAGNWTLIDENGDDLKGVGSQWHILPKESDMVSLYRQIPFEKVLSEVFLLSRDESGVYCYKNEPIYSEKFLQVVACCDILCEVLGEGLATLGAPKYKQLVRRIAQTLRNIVLLMAEYWDYFQENAEKKPQSHSLERLQTEFDEFVKRCVERLLSVARLGVYQFLADLPFKAVSQRAAEMLYVLMNVPAGSRAEVDQLAMTKYSRQEWIDFVQDSDTKLAFEERLSAMPENEIVYLLTTFCNLASARPSSEDHLVNIIAMDIYKVSFVYASTKDICSKMGRELLCAVASIHPYVISTILQHVSSNSEEISSTAFYAVTDLPFSQWKPTKQDVELLKNWILDQPLTSTAVRLVQRILKGMNWGFGNNDCLFLPHTLHCEIALLLVEVCHLHEAEKRQSGLLIKSFDQVSRVASVMRSSLSVDDSFQIWVWEVLMRLKLHRAQLNYSDSAEPRDKPSPVIDANDSTLLPRSNAEKLPQANYVTIMMTNIGYSMNVFLQQGLPLLWDLVQSGHKVPAVQCLAFIVPMFIQGNIDLSINRSFTNILHSLLLSDVGMLSGITSRLMEQKFVVPQHLELLMGSISDLLLANDATTVLGYWMKLVLSTPEWWDDENSKILLDFLFQCAFLDSPECSFACGEIFYSRHRELMTHLQKNSTSPKHQNRSVLTSILSAVGAGSSAGAPSFLRELSPNFIYLAFYLISAETRYENECKLWPTMLPFMKSNLAESALKKTSSQLKLQYSPSLAQLAIFRWAELINLTPADHPIFPAICQKFFLRYISIDPYFGASMGPKFFATPSEASLYKKMEKKLSTVSNGQSVEGDFEMKLQKLYRTFGVWLQEEKLHDSQLYLPSLPSHYEPQLLSTIRTQNHAVWTQFINYDGISEKMKHYATQWCDFHTHKFKVFPSHSSSLAIHATSCQRITQLLNQFESPFTLDLSLSTGIDFPIVVDQLTSSPTESLVGDIEQDLKSVITHAQSFSEAKLKLENFNKNYLEIMPDLYSNEEQRKLVKIECQSAFSPTHKCAGPAQVQLRFLERTLNDIVSENLKKNRASYREVIATLTNSDASQDFSYSAVHLITVVLAMIKKTQYVVIDEKDDSVYRRGAKLFYDLADLNSDERWKCPPTRHLLITCIDLLGQVFIYGQPDQAVPLLEQMLKRPEMAGLLSAHFSPAKSCRKIIGGSSLHDEFDTAVFVKMYERVVNAATNGKSSDILFVLITKFDLESWCVEYSPPKSERLSLLEAIVRGLVSHSTFSWPPLDAAEETALSRSCSTQLSNSAVQEVFMTHLSILVRNSADQVFFEAITMLLNASKDGKVDPTAWEALTEASFNNTSPGSQDGQVLLSYESIDRSIKQLAVFFSDERDSSKFGLYESWKPYIHPLSTLLYNVVVSEIAFSENIQKMNGDTHFTHHSSLVDRILPLFSAWLVPVTHEGQEKISLPWKPDDQETVSMILSTFASLLNFTCREETVDVSQCVASLWTFYLTNTLIKHEKTVASYICSSYQTALGQLPWKKFIPNLTDLDKMVQLCDSKLDCALHFLCHIVPEIDWAGIINMCVVSTPESELQWSEHTAEVLSYLQHVLFILASDEARLNSYPKLQHLMTSIDQLPWHLISYDQYDFLTNVIADKYDAFCAIFDYEDRKLQSPRYAALRLLQIASGLPVLEKDLKIPESHLKDADLTSMKRQSFIRCLGQLLRKSSKTQEKQEIQVLEAVTANLIMKIMRSVVLVIQSDQSVDETKLSSLYMEIWRSMNTFPAKLQEIAKTQILNSINEEVLSNLASTPEGQSSYSVDLILTSIMASACSMVSSPEHLATVSEYCLDLCLTMLSTSLADTTPNKLSPAEGVVSKELNLWKIICHALGQVCKVSRNELTEAALSKECALTTLALAQNLNEEAKLCGTEANGLLCNCFQSIVNWISGFTPKSENEIKLLLLLGYMLKVCRSLEEDAKLCPEADVNLSFIAESISGLLPVLEQWSMDKVKSGILGSLGIGRASPLSIGFRVSVRIISAYIVQLKARLDPEDEDSPIKSKQALESLRKLPLENRVYAMEVHQINDLVDVLENVSDEKTTAMHNGLMKKIFFLYFKKKSHFLTVL